MPMMPPLSVRATGRRFSLDQYVQRRSGNVLHHQEVRVVIGTDVVDDDNIGRDSNPKRLAPPPTVFAVGWRRLRDRCEGTSGPPDVADGCRSLETLPPCRRSRATLQY